MKLWTENYGGNLHEAAGYINSLRPEMAAGLVCMERAGNYTIAVFKVSDELFAELSAKDPEPAAPHEIILSGGADGVKFSQTEPNDQT